MLYGPFKRNRYYTANFWLKIILLHFKINLLNCDDMYRIILYYVYWCYSEISYASLVIFGILTTVQII